MASKLPPVKGSAYTFSTALYAQADNEIKVTPTLAAGDVKVIKDGGAAANIASLPSETPASSGVVSVALSSSEMDADEVVVRFLDASGAEWWSQTHVIHTAAQTYDATDVIADAIKAKTDNLPASPAAVGSAMTLANGAVTAAAIATDAIDADAIKADAVTEIQNGLATSAALATVDSNVDAILVDTNELQTDLADGGRLDLLIDAILEDTGTTLPASISGLNNLSAADVNAEVVDALNTDTYAEPGSVPAAAVSLATKVGWLYILARNKLTQTATTATLYADDGSTSVSTSAVSDDGTTATRAEWQ